MGGFGANIGTAAGGTGGFLAGGPAASAALGASGGVAGGIIDKLTSGGQQLPGQIAPQPQAQGQPAQQLTGGQIGEQELAMLLLLLAQIAGSIQGGGQQ